MGAEVSEPTGLVLRVPVDIPGIESEQLAVESFTGGSFVVRSVPVVAADLALGDIVSAARVDEVLEYTGTVLRGGNRTLRVMVEEPFAGRLLAQLHGLGCRVENPVSGLLALNLAPDAPGEGILAYLEELADQGLVQLAPGDLRRRED